MRPKINDKEIVEEASYAVSKAVYYWLNDTRKIDNEKELEEIRHDILDVLDYSKDGYEMAKDLEDKFYDSDSQLVEIMDDAMHTLYKCHEDKVALWVAENEIRPKLRVGDVVKIRPSKKKDPMAGEVVDITPKAATYTMYFAELGHVRSGTGVHGIVLSYEYVEDQLNA